MHLIAYYADPPGTKYYSRCADRLRKACHMFHLDYSILPLATGTWERNVARKPGFIAACLEELEKPVLYVDVDTLLRREPKELHEVEGSIGLARNYFNRRFPMVASVLYLQPDAVAKELLRRWDLLLAASRHRKLPFGDHSLLNFAIEGSPDLSWQELPKSLFGRDKSCAIDAGIATHTAKKTALRRLNLCDGKIDSLRDVLAECRETFA